MHSEIHLRWANWVEPDFPSRWVWQTWGHPRERAAHKVMLKEAGVRSKYLRSWAGLKFSKGRNVELGKTGQDPNGSNPS